MRTHVICLICLLTLGGAGCTLAPKVNVSEETAKTAAAELGSGMEGAAKKFGTELAHTTEPYQEQLLAHVKELTAAGNQLVQTTREMPRAFGEAVTDRLLKEQSFQDTLRGFAVLAQSPQHLASAVERGPDILSGKLEELRTELSKEDGFVTQQRNALLDGLNKERAAFTEAVSRERAEAIKELDALAAHTVKEIFSQATVFVRDSLWLVIALILVLWGLPFTAGFFLGRQFGKKP